MKRIILHWALMIAAAGLVYFTFRYWCGDFQGYLTLPIGGSDIGFAHIKSTTEWVAGKQLTPLPGILSGAALLVSLAWLAYEVRKVYKSSVHKHDVA
jgi:hypothetical protein